LLAGLGIACKHTSRAAVIRLPVITEVSSAEQEVDPVGTYENRSERPSVLVAVCTPVHAAFVDYLGVGQVPVNRPRPANFQDQLQQKSVQLQGAQLQVVKTSGSTAKAIGMVKAPVNTGAGASGVPPRGRPV
jgi:hypothetical protein